MENVYKGLCCQTVDEMSAFSSFNTDEIKQLCGFFRCEQIPAGKTLWKEGDACGYVAFIISGRVKIKKETELKGSQVVLGVYSKGAFVGALCILDGSPRAATAEAIEDVSLVVISRDDFDRLMAMYPAMGAKLMKGMLLSVSRRLKSSFDRLTAIF